MSNDEIQKELGVSLYHLFTSDTRSILRFCHNVINGRWVAVEPLVLKHPEIAIQYAEAFIDERWKEGEEIFISDPTLATRYATRVRRERWIEAEPIIRSSDDAHTYASYFFNGRWPVKVEDPILTDINACYGWTN